MSDEPPVTNGDVTTERMYYTMCRKCGALNDWSDSMTEARRRRKEHLKTHAAEAAAAQVSGSEDIWKPWPGDPRYLVSNRGQVLSAQPRKGCRGGPLHGWLINGYPTVQIGRRTIKVHTLVLETFAGPCPPGLEARHLNDVSTDNRWPENLVWGTKSENMYDRVRNGGHHNAEKTHCPEGHPYTGVNALGGRICHTCIAAATRRYRERQRVPACPD